MTSLRNGFWIVLVLASLFSIGAVAAPPADGVLFRESFTLRAGETHTGNLIALDSAVTLEAGSTVTGNLVLIGGSLDSAGRIDGDIASVGGSIRLEAPASVGGDIAAIGPKPAVDPGASVSGSIDVMEGFDLPFSITLAQPSAADTGGGRTDIWFALSLILFHEFLLCAVAVLIMLFLPSPAERVAQTIIAKPAVSFVIGLLTMLAAAALFLLLVFTVCLSPLSVLGTVVLLVAVLLGWAAMGLQLGRAVCGLLRVQAHPAVVAGIGTLILTLVASGLGFIPFAGSVLVLSLAAFGLGAVVLTRFGGPTYQILPTVNNAKPE
jgi:hypothetical protein